MLHVVTNMDGHTIAIYGMDDAMWEELIRRWRTETGHPGDCEAGDNWLKQNEIYMGSLRRLTTKYMPAAEFCDEDVLFVKWLEDTYCIKSVPFVIGTHLQS